MQFFSIGDHPASKNYCKISVERTSTGVTCKMHVFSMFLTLLKKKNSQKQLESFPIPQQRARHSVNAAAGKQEVTFAPEVPQLFGINANRLGNHRAGHRSVCELYKKLCCGHCVREGTAGGEVHQRNGQGTVVCWRASARDLQEFSIFICGQGYGMVSKRVKLIESPEE